MWTLSKFFYFPMWYLCFTSCIQTFCGILLETTSSSAFMSSLFLHFFISSESSNLCFHEDESSFSAGPFNTFLCPNQSQLIGSFLKDTQRRHCTRRLFLLSVNSVYGKKLGYIFSITSSPKRPTIFPLNASLIRGDLIWLPLQPLSANGSACLLTWFPSSVVHQPFLLNFYPQKPYFSCTESVENCLVFKVRNVTVPAVTVLQCAFPTLTKFARWMLEEKPMENTGFV